MDNYDIIVIGGGFSGLTCATIMAKEGKKVCVIEKERQLGGAFQSYKRNNQQLETGLHYVGGIGENEIMRPIIEYFELDTLPWEPLDNEFLEVVTDNMSVKLNSGRSEFIESLSATFPDERKEIVELTRMMDLINNDIYKTILHNYNANDNPLLNIQAKEYINTHFKNPTLRKILCGQAITTELSNELPLYSFLQSLNSFTQHSYRLKGGGNTLINSLKDTVKRLGGDIFTSHEVRQFIINENENFIEGIECTNGKRFKAQTFISTIHPTLTVGKIPECKYIRNIYRRRFNNLKNSAGIFTTHLILKPNSIPYRRYNTCVLNSPDPWNTPYGKGTIVQNMLINFNVNEDDSPYANNIDLLTPMDWEAVSQWADSSVGHRPEEYNAFKQKKADECIQLASQQIEGLCNSIEHVWTSTPLTYRDYTGTINGSAYGIRKSSNNLLGTLLSPLTPFRNLFLSGQNLMLHGMQGVAMTSLLTCNNILNKNVIEDYLPK